MAVPGFSVSDLIQALGQVKVVYDAFFNEYTNSAAQVRDLADDIEQFRRNLQKHKDIVEKAGLEYTGYAAVQRTLESCRRFLDEYKDVLDKRRKKSVVGAFKTARFAFEQEEVNRLRAQIAGHKSDILHYSMNVVLENSIRGTEKTTLNTASASVNITGESSHAAPTPPTPPLLGSPLSTQDQFQAPPVKLQVSSTPPSQKPMPPVFENHSAILPRSPQIIAASQSLKQARATSLVESPVIPTVSSSSRTGLSIPGLVLPQPALPYLVAEVYFENKKVELKRKAAGRDVPSGREMIIIDEAGNLRFRHRIKSTRNEPCYPYTWHSRWHNNHSPLEIGFKGTAPEAHSVSFKGAPASFTIPKYVFCRKLDFEDFQSEIRGKRLEDTFEVRQIICATSAKNGEATDQHLKLWRDHGSYEYSISYYASAIQKPRHVEFPLAMFEPQTSSKEELEVCLTFVGQKEPKRARTFSKAFSRSPTERSTSSASTTVPGVFTRNNTGMASSASSITTASNSRMSIASLQSDGGTFHAEQPRIGDQLEIQAKTMKYLRFEFSDDEEMSRFKQTYARLYQEETSRPVDFVINWQMGAARQRPESIRTSPSSTPFTMSPVLHPIRNQNSGQES